MRADNNKHKNSKNFTLKVSLVIIGLLIIMLIFLITRFTNDMSVSKDFVSQETLRNVYKNEPNITFDVSEEDFQKMIHKMTHQKVKAKLKHGVIEMSDKNIEGMLNILRQSKFKEQEVYLEILNEWKHNDFDNVVDHHNLVWEELDKPDAKAIGKMSKRTERKFIKENFTSTE